MQAIMADFAAVNPIYAKHFKAPYPAGTTIAVAALPLGASVEIDVGSSPARGTTLSSASR